MNSEPDPCAWPELVYRFAEFFRMEPNCLRLGEPLPQFQGAIRRNEVPLNYLFLLLLRWSPPETIRTLLKRFGIDDDVQLGRLQLLPPQDVGYTQPDVRIESESARIYIELKAAAKIELEQVQKYLLLHADMDLADQEKRPYLLMLTRDEFAQHWKPREPAIADVQSFLHAKVQEAPLENLAGVAGRKRIALYSARYEAIKNEIRYGAATWKSMGECLAGICERCRLVGGHETEIRILSDFVADLNQRGFMQ